MNEKLLQYITNYGSPFFVGSLVEKKVLFVNETAKKMFACTEETCDFEKIFSRSEERMESLIARGLSTGKNTLYYNFIALTGSGEKIVVDLLFGFFNEEKTEMFLELIPQKDARLQMAFHQIQNSPRAEAILNFDEKLSIIECNDAFHKVFESSEDLRHTHFKNDLVNGFLPEMRKNLISDIHKTLEQGDIFSTELKVFTALGAEKWYRLDLQKRELDRSGMKLMCYMVDIEKQVELKEENSLMIQQLRAMQELTNDFIYHIDLQKEVLFHHLDLVRGRDAGFAVPDFVNFIVEREIVHPEDVEKYRSFTKVWLTEEPNLEESTMRFSLGSLDYQWYSICRKKIYDENGVLTDVLGALINVHKEYEMKKKNQTLNQYFDVLQTISHESFYSVDVKSKTLIQKGQVAEELGLMEATKNFPESVLSKVHPEDVETYKNYSYASMRGMSGQAEVRAKTKAGNYQWYRLQCEIVHDENGDIAEVVGKMNNVQKEKELGEKYASLNHIFTAFQKLSEDILFRIDVNSGSMFQTGDTQTALALGKEIPDYVNTLLNGGVIHPADRETFTEFTTEILEGVEKECQVRVATTATNFDWFQISVQPAFDDEGNLLDIFGKMVNIQRKKDLERSASHDLMTSVLNKVSFEKESAEVLAESSTELHHALIFIDLDDFKGINDNFGHGFGDFLLTTVSKRLKRVVREHDLVGRLGGDEFSIFMKSIGNEKAAKSRVELLLDTLNRPFSFDGKTVEIKASIGFSIFPQHGKEYKDLIKKADIALYSSKGKGKNIATLYSDELEEY